MYALGQMGPATGSISAGLVTILTFSTKLGLLLGLVSFTFAQVRVAITPSPSRFSRSSTTSTDTDESEDEDDPERQPDTTTGGDPVEQVHQRYVAGEIGELALETELEAALLEPEVTSTADTNEVERAHDY
jgi:hypothetical protein